MKKILVTSPKFEGEIEVVYTLENELDILNFSNAALSIAQRVAFMNLLPIQFSTDFTLKDLQTSFNEAPSLVFTIVDVVVEFDDFWTAYDKKINRDRCVKLFAKLSTVNKQKALQGIKAYTRHLSTATWKSKADPETYLRNKYWENEWK